MLKIVRVEPLPDFKLWLEFSDGVRGEADVSQLAGKGVFRRWLTPGEFEKVKIGSVGELQWEGDLDLCPDALYMRVTGKKPEEVFPALQHESANA